MPAAPRPETVELPSDSTSPRKDEPGLRVGRDARAEVDPDSGVESPSTGRVDFGGGVVGWPDCAGGVSRAAGDELVDECRGTDGGWRRGNDSGVVG